MAISILGPSSAGWLAAPASAGEGEVLPVVAEWQLVEVAAMAQEMAEADPEYWGGIFREGGSIAILVAGDPAEAEARAIAHGVPLANVRFLTSEHSLKELRATQEAVVDTIEENSDPTKQDTRRGFGAITMVEITETGQRIVAMIPTSATETLVDKVEEAADSEEKSSYNVEPPSVSSEIAVVEQDVSVSPTGRYHYDGSLRGGALIALSTSNSKKNVQDNGVALCSTGAPVRKNGVDYIATAGHCSTNGNSRREYLYRVKSNRQLVLIGKHEWSSLSVAGNTFPDRHGDLSIYRLTGGNSTVGQQWVGRGNTTSTSKISGSGTLVSGSWINFLGSGASTFSYQGAYPSSGFWSMASISTVSATYTWRPSPTANEATIRNITLASVGGGICSSPGDSGGSIYLGQGDGSSRVVGIVSGRFSSYTNGPCFYQAYTGFGHLRNDWGGSIVQG